MMHFRFFFMSCLDYAAGEFARADSLIPFPIMFFGFVILGVKAWIIT
jgi:hypothetical protein